MKTAEFILLSPENEADFYALSAEYLPGSEADRMKKYAALFPKAFILARLDDEIIGVAFGWDRSIELPEDKSFVLDGIAIKRRYWRHGYGAALLAEFEKAAKDYGAKTVSLGSAGGYVEKFYISCGYAPKEYKIWENGHTLLAKTFEGIEDYNAYDRGNTDGFVVMEKQII